MKARKEGQAAFPQRGEPADIYVFSARGAGSTQLAFPGSENTPSLWAKFLWEFVLLSMGLIYLFAPLWKPQLQPAPPVRNTSESLEQVTPSAAPWGVCSMPGQAAGCKRQVLHFTLYFVSGGGRMRKKVSPASSCTAAVVGCSLLNLIFNHNSTTENRSLTIDPQGHFQALCKSWKGSRDLGSSPHLCINIHFKGFDTKMLLSPILLSVTMSLDSMWLPLSKRNPVHCLH